MPDGSLKVGIVVGAALGKTFGSTLKSVEQRSRKLGNTLKKARLGTALTGDVVQYKQQLDQLRKKQSQAGGSSKKLAREIAKAERQYREATRRAKRYGVEIGQAAHRHREFSRTAKDATRQIGHLQREQRKQSRVGQQARGNRLGTAAGLLGAGYVAGRIFNTAMGLEEQTIRLNTVINAEDGDTAAAVERSVRHTREVARRTLSSEAELLEIQYELNSASLSESAARVGSEVASKVATVTKGDVGQVAKIMGGVFNNLGDSIEGSNVEEKLGRIGDVLTQTQFKFALSNFRQLGEGMAEAAASASANRLSLERTAVAIGIMNTAQVTGSRPGTAMNAVLRQMNKASEELGFTIHRDAEGNLNLGATVEGLRNSLAVYDDLDERNQKIQELFGDEGMKGIIPLMDGLEQYKKGLESIEGAGGVVDKSYQKFLNSSGGQWKMLTQNVSAVSSTIGGTLLPALNAVLSPFAAAARLVGSLVDRFPVLGYVIGGVTLSIGGLMATGLASSYVSSLWKGFMDSNTRSSRVMGKTLNWTRGRLAAFNVTALVTAARTKALAAGGAIKSFGRSLLGLASRAIPMAIGGLRALTGAVMANPIGLIIGAIALGGFLIYKYWEPLKAFFFGLWGGIKPVFSAAWEGIKWLFLNLHPLGLVIKHWEPIKAFFGRLWSGVQSIFSSFWEGTKSILTTAWQGVVDWLGGVSLYDVGVAILTTLGKGILGTGKWLLGKVKGVFGKVRNLLPFSDAKEGPLSGLTASGRSIVGTLGEGVRKAGPRALQRPLARALTTATAGLTLAWPVAAAVPNLAIASPSIVAQSAPASLALPVPISAATPAPAAEPAIHYHYGNNQITIHQQPGEDAEALASHILREIERRQAQRRREGLYDTP